MATYSLGFTGAPADNDMQEGYQKATTSQSLSIDDTVARPGDQQSAMMLNTQFIARGTDGQEAFYTYDAERSDPARGIRILKRV